MRTYLILIAIVIVLLYLEHEKQNIDNTTSVKMCIDGHEHNLVNTKGKWFLLQKQDDNGRPVLCEEL